MSDLINKHLLRAQISERKQTDAIARSMIQAMIGKSWSSTTNINHVMCAFVSDEVTLDGFKNFLSTEIVSLVQPMDFCVSAYHLFQHSVYSEEAVELTEKLIKMLDTEEMKGYRSLGSVKMLGTDLTELRASWTQDGSTDNTDTSVTRDSDTVSDFPSNVGSISTKEQLKMWRKHMRSVYLKLGTFVIGVIPRFMQHPVYSKIHVQRCLHVPALGLSFLVEHGLLEELQMTHFYGATATVETWENESKGANNSAGGVFEIGTAASAAGLVENDLSEKEQAVANGCLIKSKWQSTFFPVIGRYELNRLMCCTCKWPLILIDGMERAPIGFSVHSSPNVNRPLGMDYGTCVYMNKHQESQHNTDRASLTMRSSFLFVSSEFLNLNEKIDERGINSASLSSRYGSNEDCESGLEAFLTPAVAETSHSYSHTPVVVNLKYYIPRCKQPHGRRSKVNIVPFTRSSSADLRECMTNNSNNTYLLGATLRSNGKNVIIGGKNVSIENNSEVFYSFLLMIEVVNANNCIEQLEEMQSMLNLLPDQLMPDYDLLSSEFLGGLEKLADTSGLRSGMPRLRGGLAETQSSSLMSRLTSALTAKRKDSRSRQEELSRCSSSGLISWLFPRRRKSHGIGPECADTDSLKLRVRTPY